MTRIYTDDDQKSAIIRLIGVIRVPSFNIIDRH